ncbi:MAG: hypothetical protein ABMA64_11100 [Myxococcota bacterium]
MNGVGRRWLGSIALACGVGCGSRASICEFEVEGTAVCLPEEYTYASCNDAPGGTPHDPDDTTCPDLGYPVLCEGLVPIDGPEGYDGVVTTGVYAGTEEDCAAVIGG